MAEPMEEPQVIVATPDDYSLVITVDRRGVARTHATLPKDTIVRFLRMYAGDIESGRAGGSLLVNDSLVTVDREVLVRFLAAMDPFTGSEDEEDFARLSAAAGVG